MGNKITTIVRHSTTVVHVIIFLVKVQIFVGGGVYWIHLVRPSVRPSLSKWPPPCGSHIGFFGFQTLTSVRLRVSTPNFSGTILMYMSRSLYDFQRRHFQNGCLSAILDFSVSGLSRRHSFRSVSQVCFGISNFICILMVVIGRSLLNFSDIIFKMAVWQPYWIFRFLDSQTRWHGFRSVSQVCFGISISNFICMLMVVIGWSLLIFSNVTFKMAAWWPH